MYFVGTMYNSSKARDLFAVRHHNINLQKAKKRLSPFERKINISGSYIFFRI